MPSVVPTITVGPVDVELLRHQRDLLLPLCGADEPNDIDGLVNLLDDMLWVAEDSPG